MSLPRAPRPSAPVLDRVQPVPSRVTRRGLLVGASALVLSGCGVLGGSTPPEEADPEAVADGPEDAGDAADAGDAESTEEAEEPAESTGVATVSLDGVVIEDVMDVGDLVEPLETSQTLLHPWAAVTITGTVLLHELSPERYAELTGEEVPPSDEDEDSEATVIRPGDLTSFLIATWESTDPDWTPSVSSTGTTTTLSLAAGGNVTTRLARARDGETEHSGAVLMTVDASPRPEAATVHAETDGGSQEISLIDGSVVSTIAPRLYSGSLEVEVSEADVIEADVQDGVVHDSVRLHGTVESASLTPYISSNVSAGGRLGWADEDEIYLVVRIEWDRESSSNVRDLTRIVLQLPDGTELTPEQDDVQIFDPLGSESTTMATFVIPATATTATTVISPRFGQVIDRDYEETHEPITATLTIR